MANALDAVLALAAQHQQQQQFDATNFNDSMKIFNQQQQAAQQNQTQQLQIRAGLAQNALQLNPDNSISYNGNLMNPYQQTMAKLQALSTAKQTGIPEIFQGMRNALLGGQQPNTTPSTYQQLTGQVNDLLAQNGQASGSANTTPQVSPNLNQMLTLGQSSTTDPVTGVTSTSQNQVNPAAQQLNSLATNQATAVGLANTEAAQAQSVLDEKRNTLSRMAQLRQELGHGKAVGNGGVINGFGSSEDNYAHANDAFGIGSMRENPAMAEKAATLKELAKQGELSDVQPETATFGSAGAKRISGLINSPTGDLGNLNLTDAQFNGTAKAQLINAAQKSIGLQRYANTLKNPQDMGALKDSQILSGINSEIGKITPEENAHINKMVNNTLGIKINPSIFTQQAKAHGYNDDQIKKYLQENQ